MFVRKRLSVLFAAIVFCMWIGPYVVADTLLMELPQSDIQGNSNLKGYENAIVLLDYTWGSTTPVDDPNGANQQPGSPKSHNLIVDKVVDISTPLIVKALHNGQRFEKINIYLVRNVEGENISIVTLELSGAFFQSHSMKAKTGQSGEIPVEGFLINFNQFVLTYTFVDPATGQAAGRWMSGWNYTTNSDPLQ